MDGKEVFYVRSVDVHLWNFVQKKGGLAQQFDLQ